MIWCQAPGRTFAIKKESKTLAERVTQAADMLEPILLDINFLTVRSALGAIGYENVRLSFAISVTGDLRRRAIARARPQ